MERRLYRSRSERMIWGVCGGLGQYFDVDPTIVRVIMVLLVLANGLGILAYLVLAIVMPLENTRAHSPEDRVKENVEDIKQTTMELGAEVRSAFTGQSEPSTVSNEDTSGTQYRRRVFIGVFLIVLGAILLVGTLNLVDWLQWYKLWPLAIVAVGLVLVLAARR